MAQTTATLPRGILLAASCILLVNGQINYLQVLTDINNKFNVIYDQLIGQKLFDEDRIRSEGGSGLVEVRLGKIGSKNYYSASHGDQRKVSFFVIIQTVMCESGHLESESESRHLESESS